MAEQLSCARSRTTIHTRRVMVSLSFHNTINNKLHNHDVMFSKLCNDTDYLNISSLYYGAWSVQCAKNLRPSRTRGPIMEV